MIVLRFVDLFQTFSEIENKPSSSKMANASFLDELDDVHDGVNGMHTDMGDDVFAKYHFNYIPPDLPIVGVRSQILHAIENHPVTVLQGLKMISKSFQMKCISPNWFTQVPPDVANPHKFRNLFSTRPFNDVNRATSLSPNLDASPHAALLQESVPNANGKSAASWDTRLV